MDVVNLSNKLEYLANAVNNIQYAINECGVELLDDVELGNYGAYIKRISGGSSSGINDCITFNDASIHFDYEVECLPIEDITSEYEQ